MPSIEQAVLLCGGLGTRLRAVYNDRPKALVPVNGRPFIEYAVGMLIQQGVQYIHVAAGYRAGQIKEWVEHCFDDGRVELSVSIEPSPLGTAGGLKYTQTHIRTSVPFLVMNGDSMLTHARFSDLAASLEARPDWHCVISAVEMKERGEYGTIELSIDDQVTEFREKADRNGGWVNGGIYLMKPDVLDMIPPNKPVSMEKEIFPALVESGKLGAVRIPGPLLDMGTPDGLKRTETYLAQFPIT